MKRAKPPKFRVKRDLRYMKPKKFQDHLTLAELSARVDKDPRWIRRLEDAGRIPVPRRVPMGKLEIRLWSPEQADEIEKIISGHKVGRPSAT